MDGYNITTVLKRLEAATSRLEDIVTFNEANGSTSTTANIARASSGPISPKSQNIYSQAPPLPLVPGPVGGTAWPLSASLSPKASVSGLDGAGLAALQSLGKQQLTEFVQLSNNIDPAVGKQAEAFEAAYREMVAVVETAITSSKPNMEAFVALLTPMNSAAAEVETVRDEFRSQRELGNFLATVLAGVGALGWVSIEGKNEAKSFIQEMRDSAQFYGNRAIKDREDAKPWVQDYIGFLEALRNVVDAHYSNGLQWNVSAPAASQNNAGAPSIAISKPAAGTGGAPPPPPPPSVEQLTANLGPNPAAAPAAGGLAGVFAELNQGESIASGLKPVDRKAFKASKPPVPTSSKGKTGGSNATPTPSNGKVSAAKCVPRVELVESKWHVEDLDDRHDVEINATIGQSVQIDNCRNCTVKILGKGATFNLSRCDKVGLLVETMVASCDIVNCTSFGLQVTGTVPSLMIDQSGQGSIYLSEESLGVDIFTSQTTAINVNIPEGEPGAYCEVPLGEQLVHNIVNGNIKSQVVKHA